MSSDRPVRSDLNADLESIFRDEGLLRSDASLPHLPWEHFTSDHREVRTGSLFVAIRGQHFDGHSKIDDAIRAGAALVFAEDTDADDARIVPLTDTRRALAFLAAARAGFPSRDLRMFAITGTSGKTTTSYLLESILRAAGYRVGLIGTVEIRIDGKVVPSTHTTPGPEVLQPLLARMRDEGCTAVVMEVSSHALHQSRVAGVYFDQLGFTNLSAEHLDFHPTIEDYFEAKKLLFGREWDRAESLGGKTVGASIVANTWGERLYSELPERKRARTSLVELPRDLTFGGTGLSGTFAGVTMESALIGPFNAENVLLAVQMAVNAGVSPSDASAGIRNLRAVPGRLEAVADPAGGRVILVDYAHKPDALEKVLATLRKLVVSPHRLITVVGCGGDRDRAKRPVMAEIAQRYSDHVVLTSDNPRTENPETILDEMEKGITDGARATRDSDRRRAIGLAVSSAKAGDWILIAGKGHETYQIIGTETHAFDDREVARQALK